MALAIATLKRKRASAATTLSTAAVQSMLSGPAGLAVDSAGNLLVFEGDRNRIQVLTAGGVPLRTIQPTGPAAFDDLAQAIAFSGMPFLASRCSFWSSSLVQGWRCRSKRSAIR